MIDAVPRVEQVLATTQAILALQDECGDNGWDGPGTLAIRPPTVAQALLFVDALPEDLPMPDVAGEADGEISLSWTFATFSSAAVSVGPTVRLSYSIVGGTNSEHGVVTFDGKTVPEVIVSGIRRVRG